MLAGDIIRVDFGVPRRSEAGLVHYAVVVTANNTLAAGPRTVQLVPLTTNAERNYPSELPLETELPSVSMAQCHLITTINLVARVDEADYGLKAQWVWGGELRASSLAFMSDSIVAYSAARASSLA
jgi:mRNA-degrading endonuclease toxin of MazEF toxin-antitoxin module